MIQTPFLPIKYPEKGLRVTYKRPSFALARQFLRGLLSARERIIDIFDTY